MTDPGYQNTPDIGAAAEGDLKEGLTANGVAVNLELKGIENTGGDTSKELAEMAVTGRADNNDIGAAEGDGDADSNVAIQRENTDMKALDENANVNTLENVVEEERPTSVRVEIKDKEPEEINQFDSVSNAVSQPDKKNLNVNQLTAQNEPLVTSHPSSPSKSIQETAPVTKVKKIKKGIFVSYSPDAGFVERKFVVETVKQLKENNLAEDIWFDKDEENTGSPCWFSLRMEAVEKCRAAILFLSDSFFLCPVSLYEGKTLLERSKANLHSVAIFPILFSPIEKAEPPKEFLGVLKQAVDLTASEYAKLSLAEKSSVVIGTIMETLEKYACMNLPLSVSSPDSEFTGDFKKKKICQWSAADLQEWLFKLGIKEFYRQSLAENMVDGFLLMSLTDHDMINYLGIDSRVVRKKIMQNILTTLDKEHKHVDNWHLRARSQRAKPDMIYLIYDPADVRLAQNMKNDLKKKSLQVRNETAINMILVWCFVS